MSLAWAPFSIVEILSTYKKENQNLWKKIYEKAHSWIICAKAKNQIQGCVSAQRLGLISF